LIRKVHPDEAVAHPELISPSFLVYRFSDEPFFGFILQSLQIGRCEWQQFVYE
jgi:hypothetical protein